MCSLWISRKLCYPHSRSQADWISTTNCTIWNMQLPCCCSRKMERHMRFSVLQARSDSCHFHSVVLFLWPGPRLRELWNLECHVSAWDLARAVSEVQEEFSNPEQDLQGPQPSFLPLEPSDPVSHAWSQLDAPRSPETCAHGGILVPCVWLWLQEGSLVKQIAPAGQHYISFVGLHRIRQPEW